MIPQIHKTHRHRYSQCRPRHCRLLGLNNFWIIAASVLMVTALWSITITPVSGAPAKLDANIATLPLEQPAPFVRQAFAAAYEAAADKANAATHRKRATSSLSSLSSTSFSSIDDSYGNPIETLKPIDTPDGRKVVSAQGLQFEIPNYASGITEIKQPSDDLLPPFIGELTSSFLVGTKSKIKTKFTKNPKQIVPNEQNNKSNDNNDELDVEIFGGDNKTKTNMQQQQQLTVTTTTTTTEMTIKKPFVIADDVRSDIYDVEVDNVDGFAAGTQSETVATVFNNKVFSTTLPPIAVEELNFETESVDDVKAQQHHQQQHSTASKTKENAMQTSNEQHQNYDSHQHYYKNSFKNNRNQIIFENTRNSLHHKQQLSQSIDGSSSLDLFSLPSNVQNQVVNSHANYLTNKAIAVSYDSTQTETQNKNLNPTTHNKRHNTKTISHVSASPSSMSFTAISKDSSKNFNEFLSHFTEHSPTFLSKPTFLLNHRPAAFVAPVSNGNFNYPDVPTDISVINRIAAKYHNPLPIIDPIAVALPNDDASSLESTISNAETQQYAEEQPQKKYQQQQQQQESVNAPQIVAQNSAVPNYLLELNDPDIGGPIEYTPADDGFSLKVIAWDLLPPVTAEEPQIVTLENFQPKKVTTFVDPNTQNVRFSLSSSAGINAAIDSSKQRSQQTPVKVKNVEGTNFENDGNSERVRITLGTRSNGNSGVRQPIDSSEASSSTRAQTNYRGAAYYSSTTTRTPTTKTTRPTTTTTTTTTLTTPSPTTTTTRRTTTTTTTPRPTTTTTTTTTTTPEPIIDESEFFELAAGDSYTLPPWLAGYKDEDLDVALSYVVPEDNDQYNHTLSRDLEAPLEPYADLNNLNVPAPKGDSSATTTKRSVTNKPAVTTTRRTTQTTQTTTTPTPTSASSQKTTTTTTRPNWQHSSTNSVTTPPSTSQTSNINIVSPTTNSQISSETLSNTNIKPKLSTTSSSSLTKTQHNSALNSNPIPADVDQQQQAQRKYNDGKYTPFVSNRNNNNNGAYNPQPKPFFKQQSLLTTTKATTTTTTTTPTPDYEDNPFEGNVIPSWLADFDYADVGPGVAYTPEGISKNFNSNTAIKRKDTLSNDLLPPTQLDTQATDAGKPIFVTNTPAIFSGTQHQNNPPQISSTTPKPTTTSSFRFSSASTTSTPFPSKVTNSPQTTFQNNPSQSSPNVHPTFNENTRQQQVRPIHQQEQQQLPQTPTQPPVLFKPPPPTANNGVAKRTQQQNNFNAQNNKNSEPTNSFPNTHFTAPFEPSETDVATNGGQQQNPIDQERFPPNGNNASPKTTYTKNDGGKVITTTTQQTGIKPSFNTGVGVRGGIEVQGTDYQTSQTQQSQFSQTTAVSTPQQPSSNFFGRGSPFDFKPTTSSPSTGGAFVAGGASNVKPHNPRNPFLPSPFTSRRPAETEAATETGASRTSTKDKYHGKFGGPPGVLKPYDNLSGGGRA